MIGHQSPTAMARVLVGYIDCDQRVLREMRAEFDTTLTLQTVANIRARRLEDIASFKRGMVARRSEANWDWQGQKHGAEMERASMVFVEALAREARAA